MKALLIALSLTLAAPSLVEAATRATAFDAVTTPNKEVALHAKFERNLGIFFPDLKDREVEFSMNGASLGKAQTDAEGMATVRWTPRNPGEFKFLARLVKKGVTAEATVSVLPPGKKTLVFDIDGTLSDMADWLVPLFGASAKAFPDSPELVRELAKTYHIVYLTARDDTFDGMTRTFLERHKFPKGTVIYNELGKTDPKLGSQLNPKNHGKFKLSVLNDLKAHGVTITAGIGNAATDAEAYEGARLPSYINNKEKFGTSYSFTSYKTLRDKLVADGILVSSTGLSGALGGARRNP